MKNIHIIPTDKPSRLILQGSELVLSKYLEINEGFSEFNQHIYITSDEKPKEGDWSLYQNKIHKCIEDIVGDEFKKIILTTDQSLDGIQAIDDEFLEWFVKNPSCEKVEVDSFIKYNPIVYQIILPKPKQKQKQHLIEIMRGDEELGLYEEPKQETLEEAAEKYVKSDLKKTPLYGMFNDTFIEGAKWQMERMYSEEEVLELLQKALTHQDDGEIGSLVTVQRQIRTANFYSWFEQFKKK
jgi:hypothetical protein